jgi:hypothetical protein
MTHSQRRAILRALWGVADSGDAAFRERLGQVITLVPEVRTIARFTSVAAMRDELAAIIGFYEMELGAHAADLGIGRCAADRYAEARSSHHAITV